MKLPQVLLLCLLPWVMAGQRNLYFHQLGPNEGLSQSNNAFLRQCTDGTVFIGSDDGLNVFDGKAVTDFRPSNVKAGSFRGVNSQSSFFESSTGDVWFGTGEAMVCYRKQRDSFESYSLSYSESATGLPHYLFHLEQDRFLWVVSEKTLFRFDTWHPNLPTSIQEIATISFVRAVAETDAAGKVTSVFGARWIDPGFEYYAFDEDYCVTNAKLVTSVVENGQEIPLLYISELIPPVQGKVFMNSFVGLVAVDSDDPNQVTIDPALTGKYNVTDIIQASEHELWLLTQREGVLIYQVNTRTFTPFDRKFFRLSDHEPIRGGYRFFLSPDNTLWISISGEGVYYANLNNYPIGNPILDNGAPTMVIRNLVEDKTGHVWAAGANGYQYVFSPEKVLKTTHFTPPGFQILADDHITTDQVISHAGLSEISPTLEVAPWETALGKVESYSHAALSENAFLLGNMAGLHYLNPEQGLKIQQSTLSDAFIIALCYLPEQQLLLAGTAEGALHLCPVHPDAPDSLLIGLPDTSYQRLGIISDICYDTVRKTVWLSSSTGLYQFSPRSKSLTLAKGSAAFPSQYIHAILIDDHQTLWLSSNQGIFRYQPPKNKHKLPYFHLTYRDGLSSNEFSSGAAVKAQDGSLWFGSTQGIDVFHPDSLPIIHNPPRLLLRGLRVNDRPWVSDTAIALKHHLRLKHQQNTLTFQLAAPEYTDPSRTTFRVFLEHEGRIDTLNQGSDNTVTFPNLSPGQYLFSFTAASANGVWQQKAAPFSFYIIPPIRQRTWFKIMMLLVILGIVAAITAVYYRYQLRIQEREAEKAKREAERKQLLAEKNLALEKERQRIAGEMHDDLGLGLSSISNASYRVGRKKDLQEVLSVTNVINQTATELIQNMRAIIWTMDPNFDSLEELIGKIRHTTASMLDINDISARFNIPDEAEYPSVSLSSHFRHNIYRVVKEITHNIVKHAQAETVHFTINFNGILDIKIQDNGTGFTPDLATKKGSGLFLLQKRVEELGGTINWEIPPEGGTIVSIIAPLPGNNELMT